MRTPLRLTSRTGASPYPTVQPKPSMRATAAQLLASAWTRDEEVMTLTTEGFRRCVAARGDEFHEAWKNRALPWYAEEKSRAGSFAAFVGLQFLNIAGSLRWKSIALGDSCLFIVRNHQLQIAFPVSDPKKFNSFSAARAVACRSTASIAGTNRVG
ncbi:MAG: hypothetical protein WKF84_03550 [Pyrinomonadaceae bacterium]